MQTGADTNRCRLICGLYLPACIAAVGHASHADQSSGPPCLRASVLTRVLRNPPLSPRALGDDADARHTGTLGSVNQRDDIVIAQAARAHQEKSLVVTRFIERA